jgi:hypothetical protein
MFDRAVLVVIAMLFGAPLLLYILSVANEYFHFIPTH